MKRMMGATRPAEPLVAQVIVHDDWGVFLGQHDRPFATFWTRMFDDCAPTDVVQCFSSPDAAMARVRSWGVQDDRWLEGVRLHPVVPDICPLDAEPFASMAACMAAGLPGWVAANDVAERYSVAGQRDGHAAGSDQEPAWPRPRPH